MPYPPNTIHWQPGALVIHSADAKRADMLMRVIGYDEAGLCRTEYVDQTDPGRAAFGRGEASTLLNDISHLLDPKEFNIKLQGGLSTTHYDFFAGYGGYTTQARPLDTSSLEPVFYVPPPEPHGKLNPMTFHRSLISNPGNEEGYPSPPKSEDE